MPRVPGSDDPRRAGERKILHVAGKDGGAVEVPLLQGELADPLQEELRLVYLSRETVLRQMTILEHDAIRLEEQNALLRELLARLVTKYGTVEQWAGGERLELSMLVTDPEAQGPPPGDLIVDTTPEGMRLYLHEIVIADSGEVTLGEEGGADEAP